MKWSLVYLLFVYNVYTAICSDTTDVFEFGTNVGHISFNVAGTIGNSQQDKLTRIPITVGYCMKITYVRVEVDNKHAPPVVAMDYNVNTITIKYRWHQISTSTYIVTAKAVPIPSCSSSNLT
ncbi:uncharacterized protein LOC116412738 [Galleria mellonella]|uniref:Uncharacterized protein LOC116412738 n=1 Tax=Galleria mellonella TaxID=7137 RepID=A0A6J3BXU0_GALME|nr:uncharacterized protein LOC116412738 [Galleria mellonella]